MKISATLRCGPGREVLGEDRVGQLGAGHVAAERGPEVLELDALLLDLRSSVASTTGATISETWPTRNTPSAPSITPVGASSAAANSASTNGDVERGVVVDEPEVAGLLLGRSGGDALREASSNDVPALRSASALAAAALAAAMAGPSGSVAPSATLGLDRDHPRVAELRGRRLLGEPGVDVGVGDGHALLRRRAAP